MLSNKRVMVPARHTAARPTLLPDNSMRHVMDNTEEQHSPSITADTTETRDIIEPPVARAIACGLIQFVNEDDEELSGRIKVK